MGHYGGASHTEDSEELQKLAQEILSGEEEGE
jgi:hypothetical protein